MVLCLLIGFVMASAMMSTIPIYMNASLQRMLVKDLESFQTEYEIYPGAYNTSYGLKMDISGSEQQKAVENYNNKVEAKFKELGLPEKLDKKYISDEYLYVRSLAVSDGNSQARFTLGGMTDISDHISIKQGRMFTAGKRSDGVYECVATEKAMKSAELAIDTVYEIADVLKGSGLSSSAAYEVLIGTILNGLYNEGEVSAVEIAQIAQFAENVYFGKPSGLMDQMASSVGGFITIDFADEKHPVIDSVKFDFTKSGHALCIVDTKGNHADLTPEYAAIPAEMKSVAAFFGKKVLREITKEQLLENICAVREKCSDRAVLRALHFFDDNERVGKEASALSEGDFDAFLSLINESGDSSFKYLQNIYASSAPNEQGLSLALYLAKQALGGEGACRVHGGGFAGTIQAFVPEKKLEAFKAEMERVFGEGSCYVLSIRPVGGVQIDL